MNSTDIITRVQRTFGDESGVQVTEEDIYRWINDAQRELSLQAKLLETSATATFTADGALNTVAMPANCLGLSTVLWTEPSGALRQLEGLNLSALDAASLLGDTSETPTQYWVFARTIYIHPIPLLTANYRLLYTREPEQVTQGSPELSVPLAYHGRIVEYVMKQAYELDENPEMMIAKGQELSTNLQDQIGAERLTQRSMYPTVTYVEDGLW